MNELVAIGVRQQKTLDIIIAVTIDAKPTFKPIRLLHLEDSMIDHALVKRVLNRADTSYEVVRVDTLKEFAQSLVNLHFDVVLADYRLNGFTAIDAWEQMQALSNRQPFIILSGAIGEAAAVAAIKMGISDYLLKDDIVKLSHVIQRSLEVHSARIAKQLADAELAESEKRLAGFTEHLQLAIENERASIAREIHDDIGGALAAVKFDLSWIGRHNSDEGTLTHVGAAKDMLQHAIEASQRIMMNLRPAILDQGLVAAVAWLASNFEKRTGVKTQFRASAENAELPKNIQLAAYRAAQESLTNISKHAKCDLVNIDLSQEEGVLTLEVTDNGVGIAHPDKEKPKAFGLKGMQERAKAAGGWLDISSTPGKGTSIIFSVPLTPDFKVFHKEDSS